MAQLATLSTGVRMEYVEQGDGLPIVFLHGVTDSWRSFERVLPLLPPTVHAFAVSHRGHGESSRPQSGYELDDMADDLVAFLDGAGVERAVIVGHSMGTGIAQRFAIDHPERVLALVLVGAFASFYHNQGISDFFETAVAELTDPIDPSFARAWQLGTLAREIPPDYLDRVVAETLKLPARVWKAAFTGMLDTPDFSARLRELSMPALLMWGDHDTYADRAAQERLVELIPQARLVVYRGYGHALHWEDPEGFTNDLLTFLSHADMFQADVASSGSFMRFAAPQPA